MRKWTWPVSVLVVIIAITAVNLSLSGNEPVAKDGVLDLRDWDFYTDGPARLDGEWEFFWNTLEVERSNQDNEDEAEYMNLPGSWRGYESKSGILPGTGYAAFRLRVLLGKHDKTLGMKILSMNTAYKLFVNGNRVNYAGTVGTTKEESKPSWKPQYRGFESDSNTIELVLWVSNYHHYKGGSRKSILLGNLEDISLLREKSIALNVFILGSCFIIGLYCLGLYLFRRDNKLPLCFCFLCFIVTSYTVLRGEACIMIFFPDISWVTLQRLLGVTVVSGVVVVSEIVRFFFPKEHSQTAHRAVLAYSSLFALFFAFWPDSVHCSIGIPVYDLLIIVTGIYGLHCLINALKKDRNESSSFLTGFIILLAAVMNDILYYNDHADSFALLPVGFFLFLLIQSFVVSFKLARTYYFIKKQSSTLKETNVAYKNEISGRKMAEKAMQESMEMLRAYSEAMPDLAFVIDENGKYIEVLSGDNSLLLDLPEKLKGRYFHDVMSPAKADLFLNILGKTFEEGNPQSIEYSLSVRDGIRWFEARTAPLGTVIDGKKMAVWVARDITHRKITEDALRDSRAQAHALLNATTDSAMLLDAQGIVLATNTTVARSFKTGEKEIIGKNIYSFFPESVLNVRKLKCMEVVKTGKPLLFEDEHNGRINSHSVFPVYSSDGSVERLATYTRDITHIKNAEKHIHTLTQELLKAQETERQRIARDLHDNVAQDLATLRISCKTLFDCEPDISSGLRQNVESFSTILKGAIETIRNLSYDLQPPHLEQLGLVKTLYRYCEDFSTLNIVNMDFFSAGVDSLNLGFDKEINIYRLIQEALNNIRKHADADNVLFRFVYSYPKIILRIEDDGRGFNVKRRKEEVIKEKRMGLRSMEERVMLLGGTFKIKSQVGEGTKIIVDIPYIENDSRFKEESLH